MEQHLKEIIKGIKINTDFLSKIKEAKENIKFIKSQQLSSMPEKIREMNKKLLEDAQQIVEGPLEELIEIKEDYEGSDAEKYLDGFNTEKNISEIERDIECASRILNDDSLEMTENIRNLIEDFFDERKTELDEVKEEFRAHVEIKVKKDYLGEEEKPQQKIEEKEEQPKEIPRREFIIKKSSKSPEQIREIVEEHIKINENIFNKIIFESKPPTLSISERILDIYFKPGTGNIINFISEPDTNYGKFYKNLLKVFSEIKDHIYDKYDIVVIPEEGKSISYLNSFYQNYLFLRDKINTALTQFKLQKSLLNENFTVKYLIFEKISGKYLIFYNGNIKLAEPVEQYFRNQAKLGSMVFDLEFIELETSVNSMILERYNKIKNRINLRETDNYMKVRYISREDKKGSAFVDVSGVKILIDPETVPEMTDIDIVVMTNARDSHIDNVPLIMKNNPGAKLFSSDMSYKIARVKWLKEINNPNMILTAKNPTDYDKRDLDSVNERVIRITPKGKGYNFKGLVNIKFFNSGAVPGSAVVEIRDASKKTVYTKTYTDTDTALMKGSDISLCEYDNIINLNNESYGLKPLDTEAVKNKLDEDKQVFIFTDGVGNLQHVIQELYNSDINKPVVSGEQTFGIINREISKLLNFGSMWGDSFTQRELFVKGLGEIQPFTDEYEFYKKFSTGDSGVYLLPFGSAEIDMVIKNKISGGNMVIVPADRENRFGELLSKDPSLACTDDCSGLYSVYNYISLMTPARISTGFGDTEKRPKMITSPGSDINGKSIQLENDTETEIY